MGSLVTGAGKFAHGGPAPDRYVTLGAAQTQLVQLRSRINAYLPVATTRRAAQHD